MNPDTVDIKIIGGLVTAVGSLIGVLIWLVKSSLPKLLESYRADIMASQGYMQRSLERTEQSLADARKDFISELNQKRIEYVQALKEERSVFISELDKRDRIVEKLTTAVEAIAGRVDKLTDRIEHCTIEYQNSNRDNN